MNQENTWALAGKTFLSRLLLGTGGYPNLDILEKSLEASETEIVTVAIRRVDLDTSDPAKLLGILKKKNYTLLPNTAGCFTAEEAILTAKLAREALGTNWVKLEVIGDNYSLLPDAEELLKAARILVKDGFVVLPYSPDDPVICQKLENCGCAAVMPLGAPIGSGQGIRNPNNIELICKMVKIPVIVDAGVGSPSHACTAMELGCTAVLMNTAIAKAQNPVKMATAMKKAINAGRLGFEAGKIPEKKMATPSSPERGKITL